MGFLSLCPCVGPNLGPTQPPVQCVPGALYPGVERSGLEPDHSPASSVEVNNAWSYTSTPQYVCMALCLVKYSDNYILCMVNVSIGTGLAQSI
jgi:hypothetical protein